VKAKAWGKWTKLIALPLLAALLVTSQGCSFRGVKQALMIESRLQLLSLHSDEDVNQGYPVATDVVFVLESGLFDSLSRLKASEWFSGKTDLLRQHKKKIEVMSWELVPGQSFEDVAIPSDISGDAIGILIFADYLGDLSYRASVPIQKRAVVRLHRIDFEVMSR
jgi:hypothetical protein